MRGLLMSTTTDTETAEAVAEAGFDWESMTSAQRQTLSELVSIGYDVTDYPHLLDTGEFEAWSAAEAERDRANAEAAQTADDLHTVRCQLRRDRWSEDQIAAEMATAKFGTFGGEVAVETEGGIYLMGRKA